MTLNVVRDPAFYAADVGKKAAGTLAKESEGLLAWLYMQERRPELEERLPAAEGRLAAAQKALKAGRKAVELGKAAVKEVENEIKANERLEVELKSITTPPMQRASGEGAPVWRPVYPERFQMPVGGEGRAAMDMQLLDAKAAVRRAGMDVQIAESNIKKSSDEIQAVRRWLRYISENEQPACPMWAVLLAEVKVSVRTGGGE